MALTLDRPLDHALLARLITVRDEGGNEVSGSIEVVREETQWLFRPQRPWVPGAYELVVQAILEDVAGNNLRGPLDRAVNDNLNNLDGVTLAFEVSDHDSE